MLIAAMLVDFMYFERDVGPCRCYPEEENPCFYGATRATAITWPFCSFKMCTLTPCGLLIFLLEFFELCSIL